jgi:probable rRNA maturation factor
LSITLVIEDSRWQRLRIGAAIRRAVAEALRRGGAPAGAGLTVLLTTDKRVQSLNRDFRGKDMPTNVLSFPAADAGYLGDIALAYGVTAREAKQSGKSVADHTLHLAVHGVLHLLGYDHVTPKKAKAMEPLEIRILKRLKIANPYETA